RAEPVRRNDVAGERIANEARATGIRPRGRRVIDQKLLVLAVDEVGEVPLEHFRRGHAGDVARAAGTIAEAFIRGEEEGAIAAVIQLWNPHRPAERAAEIVLAVDAFGRREEAARIDVVVADEVVRRAVNLVGAGFRSEADDSAARLPVFRL